MLQNIVVCLHFIFLIRQQIARESGPVMRRGALRNGNEKKKRAISRSFPVAFAVVASTSDSWLRSRPPVLADRQNKV